MEARAGLVTWVCTSMLSEMPCNETCKSTDGNLQHSAKNLIYMYTVGHSFRANQNLNHWGVTSSMHMSRQLYKISSIKVSRPTLLFLITVTAEVDHRNVSNR